MKNVQANRVTQNTVNPNTQKLGKTSTQVSFLISSFMPPRDDDTMVIKHEIPTNPCHTACAEQIACY